MHNSYHFYNFNNNYKKKDYSYYLNTKFVDKHIFYFGDLECQSVYPLEDTRWIYSHVIKRKINRLIKKRLDANLANFNGESIFLKTFMLDSGKYLPRGASLISLYKILISMCRHENHWKHYRLFMGFPSRGQRTWSNAKSSKKRFNYVRRWEEYVSSLKYKFVCPREVIRKVCHMEILNKIWHAQWHHEWVAARKYRINYDRRFKYKSWKFGFALASKNRAMTYYDNPFKKIKKNKRKVVLPSNQINVGLPFDFGLVFTRKVFSSKLWKEKKNIIL